MHGFYYLALIDIRSQAIIIAFTDLTYRKTYVDVDYLGLLAEFGISLQEIDSFQRQTDLQITPLGFDFPLVYYFIHSEGRMIVAVVDSPNKKIPSMLEKTIDIINQELQFSPILQNGSEGSKGNIPTAALRPPNNLPHESTFNIIAPNNSEEGASSSPLMQDGTELPLSNINLTESQIIRLLARNLAHQILPAFLVPEPVSEYNKDSLKLILSEYDIQNEFWEKIDGTWALEEFHEPIHTSSLDLQEALFCLWVKQCIYFRTKYEKWDIFAKTAKTPLYLDNGSPQYVELTKFFNSTKVIRVLQEIGDERSYMSLSQQLEMTSTRLNRYLTELLYRQIIRRKEFKPQMHVLSEDLIPLLSMQGFTNEDFVIMSKLEDRLNGERSMDDIALEINISPKKIKRLLDKYNIAMRIMN